MLRNPFAERSSSEYETIFWSSFFTVMIGVLLLVWTSMLTHVGAGLPSRATPIPKPPDSGGHVTAHIVLQVPFAPVGVWTVVQWQDGLGEWHDIKGWQGTLDEGHKKVWWVAAKDFGMGPFRWVVYQGRKDRLLATSDSFYLPDSAGENVRVRVSLSE
jgi:hypothetical protein